MKERLLVMDVRNNMLPITPVTPSLVIIITKEDFGEAIVLSIIRNKFSLIFHINVKTEEHIKLYVLFSYLDINLLYYIMNTSQSEKFELTLSVAKANIYGFLLTLPLCLLLFLIFYNFTYLNGNDSYLFNLTYLVIKDNILLVISGVLFTILGGILIHELLHGLSWALFTTKGIQSIKFGVMRKSLTPYCHCKEPLTIYQYITGILMPGVLLGIIPSIIGIISGWIEVFIFGQLFTLAAAGDFVVLFMIRNEKGSSTIIDHPTKIGCIITTN